MHSLLCTAAWARDVVVAKNWLLFCVSSVKVFSKVIFSETCLFPPGNVTDYSQIAILNDTLFMLNYSGSESFSPI